MASHAVGVGWSPQLLQFCNVPPVEFDSEGNGRRLVTRGQLQFTPSDY